MSGRDAFFGEFLVEGVVEGDCRWCLSMVLAVPTFLYSNTSQEDLEESFRKAAAAEPLQAPKGVSMEAFVRSCAEPLLHFALGPP